MTDALATHFPVSVKGVVAVNGLFALLKNERDEWELPGGKLEVGEEIDACLVREIKEELNLSTKIARPLNNWVYFVNGVHVVILTYALELDEDRPDLKISHEHKELRLFGPKDIPGLRMPAGYKQSIAMYQEAAHNGSSVKKERN